MKAIITNAAKRVQPRYNRETNQDEPVLMVVLDVEYRNDDGTLHSAQSYARLPSELDPENPWAEFEATANVLQSEIDFKAEHAEEAEANEKADDIINRIKTHHA